MRTIEDIEKEMKALEVEKEKLKNAEKEKLAKEKDTRMEEVKKAYKKYSDLKDKYIEDYGSIYLKSNDLEIPSFLELWRTL